MRGEDETKYFSKEDMNILYNQMHYLKAFYGEHLRRLEIKC